MENEIIIDGVDVSQCEFFRDMNNGEKATLCSCYKDMYGFDTDCSRNKNAKNCYYKQLKRLKAENEKLKEKCKKQAGRIIELSALQKLLPRVRDI